VGAALAEEHSSVEVAGHSLAAAAAAAEPAGLPAAGTLDNTAAANSSKAEVEADTVDVYPEVHAIYNSRNLLPTTIPLRPVSKSTGNNHRTIARRRLRSASS